MKQIIIAIITGYAILASVLCAPLTVITHEILQMVDIDSEIVALEILGKETYGHCAIQVNENVYEPRYLGLHKQKNINYEPVYVWGTTSEFLKDNTLFPTPDLIIMAAREMIT